MEGAAEVHVVLHIDAVALGVDVASVLLLDGETSEVAVPCHTAGRLHVPCIHTVEHLNVGVAAAGEIHGALPLLVGERTVLGEVHIGAGVGGGGRFLAVLKHELALLRRDDAFHVEVSSEKSPVHDESALVGLPLGGGVGAVGVVDVGKDAPADVALREGAIVVFLQLEGNLLGLRVHALDGAAAVGVPLFRLGDGDFIEHELRGADKLADEEGIQLGVALVVDARTLAVQAAVEAIRHVGIQPRQSLRGNLIVARVAYLQALEEGDDALGGVVVQFGEVQFVGNACIKTACASTVRKYRQRLHCLSLHSVYHLLDFALSHLQRIYQLHLYLG